MNTNLHWHLADNFGDQLAPYIFEKISGYKPTWVPHDHPEPFYSTVGSLLSQDMPNAIVWGSGWAGDGGIGRKYQDLRAVRGPATLNAYFKSGASPSTPFRLRGPAFGDPALLLPDLYEPVEGGWGRLWVIRSWVDPEIEGSQTTEMGTGDLETSVNSLATGRGVVSTALHPLIVAIAYGVPARWIEAAPTDSPAERTGLMRCLRMGGRFKYQDFFASIGYPDEEPVVVPQNVSRSALEYLPKKYEFDRESMAKKLMDVCPFKEDA